MQYAPESKFVYGDEPTLADVLLVPQVYNAHRFKVPLDDFPRIVEVDAHCNTLPAFIDAQPENQPDAI
jgi:glutathione S-transferase